MLITTLDIHSLHAANSTNTGANHHTNMATQMLLKQTDFMHIALHA